MRLGSFPQIQVRIELAPQAFDIEQGFLQQHQLRLHFDIETAGSLKQPQQHLAQRDLDGFVAYLQMADMRSGMDWDYPDQPHAPGGTQPVSQVPMTFWTPDGWNTTGVGLGKGSWHDDVAMAGAAADDFTKRMPLIIQDEMNAGRQIEAAGDHC